MALEPFDSPSEVLEKWAFVGSSVRKQTQQALERQAAGRRLTGPQRELVRAHSADQKAEAISGKVHKKSREGGGGWDRVTSSLTMDRGGMPSLVDPIRQQRWLSKARDVVKNRSLSQSGKTTKRLDKALAHRQTAKAHRASIGEAAELDAATARASDNIGEFAATAAPLAAGMTRSPEVKTGGRNAAYALAGAGGLLGGGAAGSALAGPRKRNQDRPPLKAVK